MPAVDLAAAAKRAIRAFPTNWSARRTYRLRDPIAHGLGAYYIRWSGRSDALGEAWDAAPRDSAGVLLTMPQGFYHATQIAQYALEQHARWSEQGKESSLSAFLAQAQWLRDNQIVRDGVSGSYPYRFDWTAYGAGAGFLSAMTQGEAISVLLRAHELVPDGSYLNAAIAAASPFSRDIEKGGVVFRKGSDVFLEEVASLPPAHILNGWIYALWGLYELSWIGKIAWVKQLYEQSLTTLARHLPLYDSGRWSYYNLLATRGGFRKYATLKYHAFHIAQLRVLTSMCGDQLFSGTADRWESYVQSRRSRAAVWMNALATLPRHFVTHADTVPGGARSVV